MKGVLISAYDCPVVYLGENDDDDCDCDNKRIIGKEGWDDIGRDLDSELAETAAVDIHLVADRFADLVALGEK